MDFTFVHLEEFYGCQVLVVTEQLSAKLLSSVITACPEKRHEIFAVRAVLHVHRPLVHRTYYGADE